MADIKQAARWMKQRKRIRRADWGAGIFLRCTATGKTKDESGEIAYFKIEELLADDWKIAE